MLGDVVETTYNSVIIEYTINGDPGSHKSIINTTDNAVLSAIFDDSQNRVTINNLTPGQEYTVILRTSIDTNNTDSDAKTFTTNRDCAITPGVWGDCDQPCGRGTQQRTWSITSEKVGDGNNCQTVFNDFADQDKGNLPSGITSVPNTGTFITEKPCEKELECCTTANYGAWTMDDTTWGNIRPACGTTITRERSLQNCYNRDPSTLLQTDTQPKTGQTCLPTCDKNNPSHYTTSIAYTKHTPPSNESGTPSDQYNFDNPPCNTRVKKVTTKTKIPGSCRNGDGETPIIPNEYSTSLTVCPVDCKLNAPIYETCTNTSGCGDDGTRTVRITVAEQKEGAGSGCDQINSLIPANYADASAGTEIVINNVSCPTGFKPCCDRDTSSHWSKTNVYQTVPNTETILVNEIYDDISGFGSILTQQPDNECNYNLITYEKHERNSDQCQNGENDFYKVTQKTPGMCHNPPTAPSIEDVTEILGSGYRTRFGDTAVRIIFDWNLIYAINNLQNLVNRTDGSAQGLSGYLVVDEINAETGNFIENKLNNFYSSPISPLITGVIETNVTGLSPGKTYEVYVKKTYTSDLVDFGDNGDGELISNKVRFSLVTNKMGYNNAFMTDSIERRKTATITDHSTHTDSDNKIDFTDAHQNDDQKYTSADMIFNGTYAEHTVDSTEWGNRQCGFTYSAKKTYTKRTSGIHNTVDYGTLIGPDQLYKYGIWIAEECPPPTPTFEEPVTSENTVTLTLTNNIDYYQVWLALYIETTPPFYDQITNFIPLNNSYVKVNADYDVEVKYDEVNKNIEIIHLQYGKLYSTQLFYKLLIKGVWTSGPNTDILYIQVPSLSLPKCDFPDDYEKNETVYKTHTYAQISSYDVTDPANHENIFKLTGGTLVTNVSHFTEIDACGVVKSREERYDKKSSSDCVGEDVVYLYLSEKNAECVPTEAPCRNGNPYEKYEVTYISNNGSHPLHNSSVIISHGDYWGASNIIISNPPNTYSFTQSQFDGTLPSHADGGQIKIRTHYVDCEKGTGFGDSINSKSFDPAPAPSIATPTAPTLSSLSQSTIDTSDDNMKINESRALIRYPDGRAVNNEWIRIEKIVNGTWNLASPFRISDNTIGHRENHRVIFNGNSEIIETKVHSYGIRLRKLKANSNYTVNISEDGINYERVKLSSYLDNMGVITTLSPVINDTTIDTTSSGLRVHITYTASNWIPDRVRIQRYQNGEWNSTYMEFKGENAPEKSEWKSITVDGNQVNMKWLNVNQGEPEKIRIKNLENGYYKIELGDAPNSYFSKGIGFSFPPVFRIKSGGLCLESDQNNGTLEHGNHLRMAACDADRNMYQQWKWGGEVENGFYRIKNNSDPTLCLDYDGYTRRQNADRECDLPTQSGGRGGPTTVTGYRCNAYEIRRCSDGGDEKLFKYQNNKLIRKTSSDKKALSWGNSELSSEPIDQGSTWILE
jgi:hypothetical protein